MRIELNSDLGEGFGPWLSAESVQISSLIDS